MSALSFGTEDPGFAHFLPSGQMIQFTMILFFGQKWHHVGTLAFSFSGYLGKHCFLLTHLLISYAPWVLGISSCPTKYTVLFHPSTRNPNPIQRNDIHP
ncbi:hypothetical protein EYC80_001225 [Monilinia laxa]|uniref:Uncharacterized protein n=1 Tax=Monilinia laxa TaxID=61186 RepID=A0A5N6K8I6_MONLA|nr:hypothetical protein EYC80_001225 [Monilinia laxa]